MAIVDERGRMFGRWNLLDFAVLVLVIGLIPLAYAGYLLFRDQPPTLVAVTPAQVREAQEFNLTIKGTNLRPYMRVSVGTQQARDFVFKSTEEAELPFTYLAPGRYDVVLYDSTRERFRLKDALTITASGLPATEVVAIGSFGNLDANGAARLTPGTVLTGAGEIVQVGKPTQDLARVFSGSNLIGVAVPNALRLPAAVKIACHVRALGGSPFCQRDNVTIAPTAFLRLPTPLGELMFQVEQVRGTQPVQTVPVTMRLSGRPPILAQVKAGDVDTAGTANELAAVARIARVGPLRILGESSADVEVTLDASLQRVDGVWMYNSAPIRAGSTITLRTKEYEVAGIVTNIGAPQP